MATAVEDLLNQALDAAGWRGRPIADIYEGSTASRVGLRIYGQTRDELLQAEDWVFAKREVALTVVANQTPPTPWGFEYTYPADCLRIRYIRPGPLTGGTRSFDPQPVLFDAWNDQRPTTAIRAILCDLGGANGAVLIYTGKVIDPGTWEPQYTKALIDRLAEKFAFKLAGDPNMVRARTAIAEDSEQKGTMVDDRSAPMPAMAGNQSQARQGQ